VCGRCRPGPNIRVEDFFSHEVPVAEDRTCRGNRKSSTRSQRRMVRCPSGSAAPATLSLPLDASPSPSRPPASVPFDDSDRPQMWSACGCVAKENAELSGGAACYGGPRARHEISGRLPSKPPNETVLRALAAYLKTDQGKPTPRAKVQFSSTERVARQGSRGVCGARSRLISASKQSRRQPRRIHLPGRVVRSLVSISAEVAAGPVTYYQGSHQMETSDAYVKLRLFLAREGNPGRFG
jgi:hypothetical protein